ncbi:hypothetical protein LNTAR_14602 [Lentisphaera araneosa HTCC2155]|uniref:Prepilin-type N-terminal cleavage/methylation domain-containing protein n=1 Tax=Lentisphaera araneosa HTCC2155 TaxID=313628 RepID=A6DHH2_9BACT|nr:hypothetical protein [Lentisphaera araneosa]EDM29055.1 hypothetical protein LNTAR_14602 [Lentisphaera araneosa HTCC2155]
MKKYTLIELLVAMGIFAFMMLLLMNFFSISTDLLGRENNRATKLYEASIISSLLQQDLKGLSVNGTDSPFEYHTNRSGKTYLRFISEGYDENTSVDSTVPILVSYIYDFSTKEIFRYVESVSDFETTYGAITLDGSDKIANFNNIETSTNGALILEGVEAFDLVFYEAGNFKTFTASVLTSNSNFSNLRYSNVPSSGSALTTKPDSVTIQMALNDKDVIGITGLEDKNRRTITQQFILGYND